MRRWYAAPSQIYEIDGEYANVNVFIHNHYLSHPCLFHVKICISLGSIRLNMGQECFSTTTLEPVISKLLNRGGDIPALQRQVTLRSATTNDLFVPRARLRFGERTSSIAAPLLWNSLPAETRNVATLETFKKKLKTFMFYKHLGDWL